VIHPLLLHNGVIRPAAELCLTPGQVGLLSGWGVFSTIKVFHGVLFALERHWTRMRRDAQLLRIPFPWQLEELERMLFQVVEANQAANATLRVVVVRNRGGIWEGPGVTADADLIAFTTELKDWGKAVRLGVVEQARHAANRFAGVKVLSWATNLALYEEARERGFDEVLLLNERGEVAECTSANVFAAFGQRVVTPPLSSGCLPGVTRELLLGEVRAPGIDVVEASLRPADLARADGVFITSSTRDMLPVESIEGLTIGRSHEAVGLLQVAFHGYVDRYVESHSQPAARRR
jgi:branched-chain amino acid aminotransferase